MAKNPRSIPHLCGSISGKPSPFGMRMHNAAYADLKIPYTYVAFGLDTPEAAINAVRTLGIRGLGVSAPHKVEIMKFLDSVDPIAQEIGAVNTVVNNNGILTGHNFDWIGAETAISEVTPIAGKRFLVIGAGGAARAICYALQKNGAEIIVLNRDRAKAESLAKKFDIRQFGTLTEIPEFDNYDVLVNATSVGLFDSESCPIPESHVPTNRILFEVIHYPLKTKLVRLAEIQGCRIIPGIRMLVYQAMRQFELYTGCKPGYEVMEKALIDELDTIIAVP